MDIVTKPPLGVMPRHLWAEGRLDPSLAELRGRLESVRAAADRYAKAGLPVHQKWRAEIHDLHAAIRRKLETSPDD